MRHFSDWLIQRDPDLRLLDRLRLLETYFSYDAAEYDKLFSDELERLALRLSDPVQRQRLESMRGFKWTAYISSAVRSAGFTDYRDVREKAHDIVAKLLTGPLFRGFDPQRHGPMDLRFRRSVGNAIRNLADLEKNRRKRYLPLSNEFTPGAAFIGDIAARQHPHDETMIEQFRSLVQRQLGQMALAILDARLNGEETQSMIGRPELGNSSRYDVKQAVQAIKRLARDFAVQSGDSAFLTKIERALASEAATIQKRQMATASRQ